VGAADVALKQGTKFVLPVAIWFGESYNTDVRAALIRACS
jgi:hypothetical protein